MPFSSTATPLSTASPGKVMVPLTLRSRSSRKIAPGAAVQERCRSLSDNDGGFRPPDLLLVFRAERGVAQPDDDAVDFARELERHVVVLADRRAGVLADIQRFIDRDAERDGALDPALGDLLVVHRQRGRAAFADAAA